ncbi:MAG TPA: hypothetical protein VN133_03950 [Humibacter sp.]|jgi:hypothetical protein|nr:hypothetical protein [Humibacter sp.]
MPLTRRLRSRAVVFGAVAIGLTIALAGCSTNSTKPVTDYAGEPKGIDAPAASAGGAPFSVWLKNGDQFTITLYGSSVCPPIATKYSLVGKNTMKVTVPQTPTGKKCAMDYTPHTTVFSTPNTIDRHRKVMITAQQMTFTLAPLTAK